MVVERGFGRIRTGGSGVMSRVPPAHALLLLPYMEQDALYRSANGSSKNIKTVVLSFICLIHELAVGQYQNSRGGSCSYRATWVFNPLALGNWITAMPDGTSNCVIFAEPPQLQWPRAARLGFTIVWTEAAPIPHVRRSTPSLARETCSAASALTTTRAARRSRSRLLRPIVQYHASGIHPGRHAGRHGRRQRRLRQHSNSTWSAPAIPTMARCCRSTGTTDGAGNPSMRSQFLMKSVAEPVVEGNNRFRRT